MDGGIGPNASFLTTLWKRGNRMLVLFSIIVVMCMFFTWFSDNFLKSSNLINIARQVSITAIASVGMTMVMITGGIDLSIGALGAFTGVIAAGVFNQTESAALCIVAGLVVGFVIGLFNGLVTAKGNIPAFITTLAVMNIIRGTAYIYTSGYPISVQSSEFKWIGVGYVGALPVPVYIMFVVAAVGWFITEHTRFGRQIYALGGNENASLWSGVNVVRVKVVVYVINGALAAVSGLVLSGRLASGQPSSGQDLAMDVITASVVGGTSMAGGRGTIAGAMIGAFIIGILNNGMTMLDVGTYYQMVIKGIIILVAVLIDQNSGGEKK
jgi:ribose transport system permease protein